MAFRSGRWTQTLFTAPLVACSLWLSAGAQAGPYTFVNIADSSGPYSSFGRGVSLNGGGTVAFSAALDAGGAGVFTGAGGPVATIADSSGPFSAFGIGTGINSGGTVAFQASLDTGGSGIFSSSGALPVTIAGTGAMFSGFSEFVSINSGGTVAFLGNLAAGGSGVFTGAGGAVTTIADTSGPYSGFFVDPSPPLFAAGASINAGGTAAFLAALDAGGAGIFTGSGGPVATIADTSGPLSGFARHPTINDSGTVALTAGFDGGGAAIFTGNGGALATIVDTSGPFNGFGEAAINNGGTVAFLASRDAGGGGYFTSDDMVNGVLELGDPLFSSIVTGLEILLSFNDAGQIAFFYDLANGRAGVARADPAPVASDLPEPASLALVFLGLAVLGFGRRRVKPR